MRGRKPLPAHLHVINGTATAQNQVEAPCIPVPELPPPPSHLNADGRHLWNEMGKELIAVRSLASVDLFALSQLAYLWQKHIQKARADMDPVAAESSALRNMFSEFGATPSSRRRMTPPDDDGQQSKKNRFKKFKQT